MKSFLLTEMTDSLAMVCLILGIIIVAMMLISIIYSLPYSLRPSTLLSEIAQSAVGIVLLTYGL